MLKKALLHIRRNKLKSFILFIVFFLMALLMTFSFIMKEDGTSLKNIITNSLDLRMTLKGTLTYGVYGTYENYLDEYEKIEGLKEELNDSDYVKYVYQDIITAPGYITIGKNLDDTDTMVSYNTVRNENTNDEISKNMPAILNEIALDNLDDLNNIVREKRELGYNSKKYEEYLKDYSLDVTDEIGILQYRQFLYDMNTKIGPDVLEYKNTSYYKMYLTSDLEDYNYIFFYNGDTELQSECLGIDSKESLEIKEDVDIVEGRNFTDDEIKNGARVVIIPINTFMVDKDGYNTKVEVGDMIPVTIHNGLNEYMTIEYEVIGLHDGIRHDDGYVEFEERNFNAIAYNVNSSFNYNLIFPENTLIELYEEVNKFRSEDELPLVNSVNVYKDEIYVNPRDYLSLGDLVIGFHNFDDYAKAVEMIEETINPLNEGHEEYQRDYHIESTIDDYYQIAGTIESNQRLFEMMSYVSLVVVLLLMILVYIYQIKRRKEETALLISLGDDKGHIYNTYFLEYLMIGIFSYFLAGISSVFLTTAIKKMMVDQNIAALSKANDSIIAYYEGYLGFDSYHIILILFVSYLLFILIGYGISRIVIKEGN